jgi:hypothetical protein
VVVVAEVFMAVVVVTVEEGEAVVVFMGDSGGSAAIGGR